MFYKAIVSNFCHKYCIHKYFKQVYQLDRYSECKLLEGKHAHNNFGINLYVTFEEVFGKGCKEYRNQK